MEQSSLSLASSINAHGVYHIGWSEENTERVGGHDDNLSSFRVLKDRIFLRFFQVRKVAT